ncbi:MAG: diguanylate cyclase domain-containing protein [Rhodoferax sp.]
MTELEPQLSQYAADFRELAGRHYDLEYRYERLKASHMALAQAREALGSMSPTFYELCLAIDAHGTIQQSTDSAQALFMLNDCQISRMEQIVAPFQLGYLMDILAALEHSVPELSVETADLILYPGGEPARGRLFAATFLPKWHDGQRSMYCILRDLSWGEQADVDTDRMFALVKSLHHGAMVFDTEGRVVAVDELFATLTGYSSDILQNQIPFMFETGNGQIAVFDAAFWAELRQTGQWRGETSNRTKDQRLLRQWMSVTAMKNSAGVTQTYVAVMLNREVMLNAERSMIDTLYHDPVTGLPNMDLFRERAEKKFAMAPNGARLTLLSVMLDRRQWIHDTLGRSVSETVLTTMSERLQEVTRGCDKLARAGFDRFQILLNGPRNESELSLLIARILNALSTPIAVRGSNLVIGGSVGAAVYPNDGADLSTLIEYADAAMHRARKEGGNRCCMHQVAVAMAGLPAATSKGETDFQNQIPTIHMGLD